MNLLANILIAIVLASVLYGAVFSRPRDLPPAEGGPETAPRSLQDDDGARSGRWRLIAEGMREGFESFGGIRKW